jgi:hypothetical protein
VFDPSLFRRYAFQIILVFCLLGGRVASAQSCVIDRPRYNLIEDTVGWSMKIAGGRSCARGVRFANVIIESLKLVSPPQSGQIALQGLGFTYTAKADFRGQDSFSLTVFGTANKTRGSSTIHVTVSVTGPPGDLAVPDTTPPSVSLTAPSGGATVSGSSVTLTATASDNVAVANVQFNVDGSNIGSAVASSPYTTTWNSTGVADGSHTLYAIAQDTSGNYATSSISVTVKNMGQTVMPRAP